MKSFRQFLLIALLLAAVSVYAQNRYWVIPPNYVDFYTGQVLPLPNTAISPATTVDFVDLISGTSSTISGIPLNKGTDYTYLGLRSSNGVFYKSGDLRYYLNNKAFVTSGNTIVYKSSYSEDLPILPVPNNCDYFFLIKDSQTTDGGNVTLNYKKVSRDGLSVSDNSLVIPESLYPWSRLNQFAVSPMKHDIATGIGSYKLYAVGYSYVYEFNVTHSGISLLNKYLHYNSLSHGTIGEVELSPNGRYLAWTTPAFYGFLGIKVTDLQTGTSYAYVTESSSGDHVIGIEFSESSDKIYFCALLDQHSPVQNKIGYFSLGTGQLVMESIPKYTLNASDITYVSNTGNLSGSYIEKAVDGNMYVSDGNYLRGFDPNNPSLGIIKSLPIYNPPTTVQIAGSSSTINFYTLVDQIDNADHASLFQVGCDLSKTISNVTSSDGGLPAITKVSQNITAQTNVTVATGTSVTFKAGDQILLQPGFTVTAGGNFNGKLEYCDDFVIDYCNGSGRITRPIDLPLAQEIAEGDFISVFPNPTTGMVSVRVGSGLTLIELEVADVGGSLIMRTKPNNTRETILDLSWQTAGIYLIKIRHNKGIEIRKLIIAK